MAMAFIDGVNRCLRINGILRGDTDVLLTFADTSHNSTSQLAQIAIQTEITELASKSSFPYQHKTNGSLTCVTAQRTYALASDFIQLWGRPAFFYDAAANYTILQYPSGENQLRTDIQTYRTDPGYPLWYYFELGTTQQVSFYPVPDATRNGLVITYDYSASVNVVNSTDVLPLTTTDQQYAFIDMASRRFKFLFEGKVDIPMDSDPVYREARSRLFSLMGWKQPPRTYGKTYVPGQNLYRY
jgi:hypothetical protein